MVFTMIEKVFSDYCGKCGGERDVWIHYTELPEKEIAKHAHDFVFVLLNWQEVLGEIEKRDAELAEILSRGLGRMIIRDLNTRAAYARFNEVYERLLEGK